MLPYLHIFGIEIPMYGLMMAVGFLTVSVIAYFRTKKRGLQGENLIIIAAMILLGALLGGKLMYTLVTWSPAEIRYLMSQGEWDLLLGGGIVFYGGLIGGIIGAIIGSLIARDDLRNYMDIIIPVMPLGHAIGRIGCLCAGCCYGRPTDSAIGIVYPENIGGAPVGVSLLPVPLFEAAANLVIFAILMYVSHKTVSKYLTTFLYCILYGITRFILEFFRYDSIRGIAGGLSTSQWISLGLIAGALIAGGVLLVIRKTGKTKASA